MDTFFIDLSLRQVALIVGTLGLALHAPLLAAPATCRAALPGFQRNAAAAWILTAVDLLWVTWIVSHATLGRFEFLKPSLYVLTPASFFILVNFLDELLASRALGGFLLLAANPVLNIARWHEAPERLVLAALAYVWVIAGIILVLSPYMFRRWSLAVTRTDGRCRAFGALNALLAGSILYLGLAVF